MITRLGVYPSWLEFPPILTMVQDKMIRVPLTVAYTPAKTNMAMENHHVLIGDTFSNGSFSVDLLVFGGVIYVRISLRIRCRKKNVEVFSAMTFHSGRFQNSHPEILKITIFKPIHFTYSYCLYVYDMLVNEELYWYPQKKKHRGAYPRIMGVYPTYRSFLCIS